MQRLNDSGTGSINHAHAPQPNMLVRVWTLEIIVVQLYMLRYVDVVQLTIIILYNLLELKHKVQQPGIEHN